MVLENSSPNDAKPKGRMRKAKNGSVKESPSPYDLMIDKTLFLFLSTAFKIRRRTETRGKFKLFEFTPRNL